MVKLVHAMKACVLLSYCVALLLSGCAVKSPRFAPQLVRTTQEPIQGPRVAPAISVTAVPAYIASGQSATLSWTTNSADSVTIDGNPAPTEGTLSVSPAQTTTYTVRAEGLLEPNQATAMVEVTPTPPKVIFLGDSITAFWQDHLDFASRNWIDSGIMGQTCADMLARFQSDVVIHSPVAVHIMCGTNDINRGLDLSSTEQNLQEMIRAAQTAKIRVILATIPYICIHGVVSVSLNSSVDSLNHWIEVNGSEIANYHTVLTDPDRQLNMNDSDDGLHPNAAGYAAMTPAADFALSRPHN